MKITFCVERVVYFIMTTPTPTQRKVHKNTEIWWMFALFCCVFTRLPLKVWWNKLNCLIWPFFLYFSEITLFQRFLFEMQFIILITVIAYSCITFAQAAFQTPTELILWCNSRAYFHLFGEKKIKIPLNWRIGFCFRRIS